MVCFFHDLGKALTLKKSRRNGRLHTTFYNHQNLSAELVSKIAKRLRFSNAEATDIIWFVKNHHVPYELKRMRPGKQMAWCLDERFGELLKLFRADSLATIPSDKRGKKGSPDMSAHKYSSKLWKRAQSKAEFKKPLVTGHDVMKVLRIKPGPEVGKILSKVRELQLEGKIKNREETYKWLRRQKN